MFESRWWPDYQGFLYYANEGSNDVISCFTKTVKYWIKNISKNISGVFFKLGTRNVHQKRNKTIDTRYDVAVSRQSLSVKKPNIHICLVQGGQRVLSEHTCVAYIVRVLTLIRFLEVDNPSWNGMEWNAMQCNAVECNAMQCNAMQWNAMKCKSLFIHGESSVLHDCRVGIRYRR